jgi:replicative DNA helicase
MSDRKPRLESTEDLLAKANAQLPFSDEAEKGFLSCLLQDPAIIGEAKNDCPPAMFYHPANEGVYSAIVHLHNRFKPVNVASLSGYLRDNEQLDRVGGPSALSEIYTFIPIPSDYPHFRDEILDKHARRQLIRHAAELIARCREPDTKAAEITEEAQTSLQVIAASQQNDADMLPCRPLSNVLDNVLEFADRRQSEGADTLPGVSTGIAGIDERTGGMQPGKLWIVGGMTSDGKSSLAQNFVESGCSQGHHGIVYSYEMGDEEIAGRILCSQGFINSQSILNGSLSADESRAMIKAANEVRKWNLDLLDVAGATIESITRDLRRRVLRIRKTSPEAKIVAVVDYVQLATTFARFDNRERALAHISCTAKNAAKTLRIAIIMPSQLNDDGKIRESRAITHDADVLLMLHKKKIKGQEGYAREIYGAKNRGGPRDWRVPVEFRGEFYQFSERN